MPIHHDYGFAVFELKAGAQSRSRPAIPRGSDVRLERILTTEAAEGTEIIARCLRAEHPGQTAIAAVIGTEE